MGRPRLHADKRARDAAYRARRREKRRAAEPRVVRPKVESTPAAVARWAAERLVVPPGHPAAGRPFSLPPWQLAIIRDCLTCRETCLCVARKNGKSALVAVLVLAYLCGPLRRPGWRCGVLSANRGKAGELLRQIGDIASASNLQGLTFRRSPWPGKVIAVDTDSTVEIEGASEASGHSAGYDLSIIDEIGLLQERHRPMVAGMRSAVSARDGRFLTLSIHGSGPFVDEILGRPRAAGKLAVHHYRADPDLPIDDPKNWKMANPGLGSIKATAYMRDESARVLLVPSDQASFRAHDLNLPGEPAAELVCSVEAWRRCETGDLPGRDGPCTIGLDLGAHRSLTSAAAYWPSSGRLDIWSAVGDQPKLAARARADGAGSLYERAVDRADLTILSGSLTPVGPFLARLRADLGGVQVAVAGADGYRRAELEHHLSDLGIGWRMVWRGGGVRSAEDAAHDIGEFQRAVDGGRLRTRPNVLMAAAMGQATVVRDSRGHPTMLGKARKNARIDCLSASVIAVGLGAALARRRSTGNVYVA